MTRWYQRQITLAPRSRGLHLITDEVVRRQGDAFRVLGTKPLRWVRQTDFGNEEAVRYLADRF